MAAVGVLWRIWRSRNWVVSEGKQFSFPALIRQFNQLYDEWVSFPSSSNPLPRVRVLNQPGMTGVASLVCRWDGATRKGSHSEGGMVILNAAREVILARGLQFPVLDDPMVVELLVLHEATLWCRNLGFVDITFKGDAKVIIDKINQKNVRDNRMGALLEEVVHYFNIQPDSRIRFIGRDGNRVAHLVARKALALYPAICRTFDFQTWLNSRM
ncbi:unnamed protein product [Linum trigynum]|uniref:RNase H type-1 domain-containing protein n=1 Tax=Linum trigynum TaxID=586398 RepID=A0AAV2GQ08_9ROSI